MKTSVLNLRWHHSQLTQVHEVNWQKRYYEYYIDDVSLPDLLDQEYQYQGFIKKNQYIGTIYKSTGSDFDRFNKQLFLGNVITEKDRDRIFSGVVPPYAINSYMLNGQVPIYTCPCGDITCSGLVVKVDTDSKNVKWSFGKGEKISPIYFDKQQYGLEVENTFKTLL